MKRKTKLTLIGAIAVGVLTVLFINLSTPQPSPEISELRKPAPEPLNVQGRARQNLHPVDTSPQ